MPELPEVETVRRQLAPGLEGRRIVEVCVDKGPRYGALAEAIDHTILNVGRRGKYLLLDLGDRDLVIHLGMSGRLAIGSGKAVADRHVRATFRLDDGRTLAFSDMRRFGTLGVLLHGTTPPWTTLRTMGPEPLSHAFTAEGLHAALGLSRRSLKASLLSQRPVAGLGNIYVDEALHRAGLHPATRHVSAAEARRLHAAIVKILSDAVAARGTTFQLYRDGHGGEGDYYRELRVYDRAGQPCRACGTTILKTTLEGRGTHWCPECQPEAGSTGGPEGHLGVSLG